MKLSLLVLTPGTMQGKSIPIALSQFLIGRDAQCHLRPASPLVSKRHCALLVRGNKAFVRDLGSTNGTYVNGQAVTGEVQLSDQDQLRVGPVAFQVRLEATRRVDKPMPLPVPRAPVEAVDDEAMAALLLALPEDGGPISGIHNVDTQGIPTGNTVMDRPVPAAVTEAEALAKSAAESKPAPPPETYDTAAAAKSLLKKYRQQSRK